jgi:hypothetical protein
MTYEAAALVTFALFSMSSTAQGHAAGPADAPIPACRPADVRIHLQTEGEGGMSHDGALIVIRNTSAHACSVPRRPTLTFLDAAGTDLKSALETPRGMHPGPALTPLTIQPGAAVSGETRWVSGEVYDESRCDHTARIVVALGAGSITRKLRSTMCRPAGQLPTYEEQWFQPVAASGAGRPD